MLIVQVSTIRRKSRRPMKKSWLLTAMAALSLVGSVAATAPAAAAAVRPDVPVVTICLTYARSFCADVKNARNVSGQPIWLFKASGAKDYHFYDVNVNCPLTGVPGCAEFVDVKNTALCIGVRNNRNVVLLGCNAFAAEWVQVAQGVHYIHWANQVEYLTVSSPVNRKLLTINFKHAGGWQQWTGP
jgi:hypothetical protein